MNSSKFIIAAAAAAAAAVFGAATSAYAQSNTTGTAGMTNRTDSSATEGMNFSDRNRMNSWTSEQEKLVQVLKAGIKKSDYQKILTDNGYTITAINKDVADSVEYEVVKGDQSYEVQIDLDKATGMGSKVEVGTNMWRADATQEAMRSGKAVAATKPLANGDVYSDRANRQGWTDQKDMLEKRLVPGKDVAFYTGELKKMGYQITSTNDREKDYVELEVVKGRDSYEVQMDRNDAGMVDKIDVTTNMWQADSTERALARTTQPLAQRSTNRPTAASTLNRVDGSGTTDMTNRTDGRLDNSERVARADRN